APRLWGSQAQDPRAAYSPGPGASRSAGRRPWPPERGIQRAPLLGPRGLDRQPGRAAPAGPARRASRLVAVPPAGVGRARGQPGGAEVAGDELEADDDVRDDRPGERGGAGPHAGRRLLRHGWRRRVPADRRAVDDVAPLDRIPARGEPAEVPERLVAALGEAG